MNVLAVLLIAVYGVIGGVSTLFLSVSLPALIIWKYQRKV